MYISSYRRIIQIFTVQSEEQHVMNLLSNFHLNRTVNKSGNAILRKLRKLEKYVALEMTNKPVPVGIARTRPRFDGESPN